MAFKSYYKLVKYQDPRRIPFYVEDASGAANTMSIRNYAHSAPQITIETSTDATTWTTLGTTSAIDLTFTVPANGKLYFRCNANTWSTSSYQNTFYSPAGNIKVGGNIMSLLYGSNFTGNETSFPSGSGYNFRSLFWGVTSKLVDASSLVLPATTLTDLCYQEMFSGCGVLTSAPALPATTLALNCCLRMFQGCTSLTSAPALPATTLATGCYEDMFKGCTSLTSAPALPATTLATGCYASMFSGCTSLTTTPALPATTLAQSCYNGMFYGCTSLTTSPVISATRIPQYACGEMFSGCTSLNSVTCLATSLENTLYSCRDWLKNVAATGTFTKAASMSSWPRNASGIPFSWTVVNA